MIDQKVLTIRAASDRDDAVRQASAYLAKQGAEVTGVISVTAPFGAGATDWTVEVQTHAPGPVTPPRIEWP